jgi:hypothetical protein
MTILHTTDQIHCKHCGQWHPVAPYTVDSESPDRAVTTYPLYDVPGRPLLRRLPRHALHSRDASAADLDAAERFAGVGLLPAVAGRARLGRGTVSERGRVRVTAFRAARRGGG